MKRALSISCLWICLLVLSSSVIMGQDNHLDITPTPQSLVQKNGHFTLNSKTSFAIGKNQRADLKKVAAYFQSKILYSTGYNLNIKNSGSSNAISLQIDKSLKIGNEGYQLTVTPKKVIVKAKTPQGIFYGMQSVMQLLPPQIESETIIDNVAWEIKDEPAYGYRGMMLDVCRHFHDVEFVKKQLDIMAMFKMNYFHWHLTDDHLWTIEIKKYPRLAEVGSVRRNADGSIHRGFYTQEQIKEVVAYAAERYITVIPEVELPGHALAALTAYPEYSCTGGPFELRNKWGVEDNVYCAGNDKTFEFLQDILEEVIPLFPGKFFHIGGDECYKGFWEKCPKCKMRMQKEHLKNLEELQSYFVKRVAAMVQKRGKQVIGWDEILEGGLAPEAIVMSWRGMKGGIEAAKQGHSVIMTPTDHCYLDFYQGDPTVEPNTYSMLRLQDCYKYQLIPDSVDASLIMGGQGNLWTESVPHYRQVEYMIWPRALAISETLWTDARLRNWKFFVNRVEQQFERFDRSGVNYARSIYDPIIYPHWDKERQLKIAMKTEIEGLSLFYTFDNTIPDIYSNMYTDTLSIPKNASMLRIAAYKGQEQAGRLIDITIDVLKKRAAEGEKK
jgi:hexosaminidase